MHRISICMGSSCFSRGNRRNLEILEKYIQARSIEAQVDLSGSRCLEKCAVGPVINIDGEQHCRVDEGMLLDILERTFE